MEQDEFFGFIEPHLDHKISSEQKEVIKHESGPLWVVAGPGSGKTEVLVLTTLKKIFVDNINPKSILITTFTKKAAKNLHDRILTYARYVFDVVPELENQIDFSELRIGTLHSLCENILEEYRYPCFENIRMMDEIEQYLFIYDHSNVSLDTRKKQIFRKLWEAFPFMFSVYGNIRRNSGWVATNYPSRRDRTKAAISLFNRVTEDLIDVDKLRKSGNDHLILLADAYEDYEQKLLNHGRCDFANVQKIFLEFLKTDYAMQFLAGDGTSNHPGIECVLVDEYQDTNPIQEAIYFYLAKKTQNLIVVGDDDQALYRFRGASVDGLVTFDKACKRYWGLDEQEVTRSKKFLKQNYRSHEDIVTYYDEYIKSFPDMNLKNARVEEKPQLVSKKKIEIDYPPLVAIRGKDSENVAKIFAELVRNLINNGIIESPSQCALLMQSVKGNHSKPFAEALKSLKITPYNPR
ncbi:MAG: UvrD-helicase domain-containing protein, partial [Candidatus Thermoplasmatota archaeon]|nr:UvrD-helicase domain-containing protein [Candidatus Thermoplasmatota archaeon]